MTTDQFYSKWKNGQYAPRKKFRVLYKGDAATGTPNTLQTWTAEQLADCMWMHSPYERTQMVAHMLDIVELAQMASANEDTVAVSSERVSANSD